MTSSNKAGRPIGSKQTNKPLKGKAISRALPASKRLKDALPVVKNDQGFEFQLTDADLDAIEDMVSIGAPASYVANTLGICEAELNIAIKNSVRVERAIKRGLANDEMEITSLVREQIAKGNMVAAIWYQKNKHGWRDNDNKGGNNAVIVNVSTGINRADDSQVIDIEGNNAQ